MKATDCPIVVGDTITWKAGEEYRARVDGIEDDELVLGFVRSRRKGVKRWRWTVETFPKRMKWRHCEIVIRPARTRRLHILRELRDHDRVHVSSALELAELFELERLGYLSTFKAANGQFGFALTEIAVSALRAAEREAEVPE